jgi:hypothetical protein
MKWILRISATIVLLNINSSCIQDLKSDSDFIRIDIESIISDKPIYFSALFNDFKIIPLELNNESLIGYIRSLKLINDTFYILDGSKIKTLYQFSSEGKYLNRICKIGKGPGEYIDPVDFDINTLKRQIVIFDWSGKKMILYDLKGNYLNEIKINNRFFSFITAGDKYYSFIPSPENPKDLNASLLYQYDSKGLVKSKHFTYKDYGFGLRYNTISNGGNFFLSDNDIKFYMPLCDTIFSIKGTRVLPFIALNSGKYKLNISDIEKINQEKGSVPHLEIRDLKKLYNIRNYGEYNKAFFFKFDIGVTPYWLFYNWETDTILCSWRKIDDITYLNPDIFPINENQFAGIINERQFSRFKDAITTGQITLPSSDLDNLLKISESGNPVIIIYDVKKN